MVCNTWGSYSKIEYALGLDAILIKNITTRTLMITSKYSRNTSTRGGCGLRTWLSTKLPPTVTSERWLAFGI